jgi:hypothetical protein
LESAPDHGGHSDLGRSLLPHHLIADSGGKLVDAKAKPWHDAEG